MKTAAARIYEQFPSAAEYLTCIYIIHRDYGAVNNSRLASWVGVSNSAVTQSLARLKRLGLARQERYGTIALTAEGVTMAVQVLRRHYLLEHLLVRVLEYPWEKADEEAKQLQSQISDDLTEHLFEKLGFPQTCPHGNPLPGSPLEAALLAAPRLSDAPIGGAVRIVRITEEGEQIPHMLDLCHSLGIQPGATFRIQGTVGGIVSLVALSGPSTTSPLSLPRDRADHVRFEPVAD